MKQTTPRARYFPLDVVRATAMPMIVFFHYNCATTRIISADVHLFKHYGYAGQIGVSLFLILSGAALTLSTRTGFSPLSFFKKRFMAIYPLFWTVYVLFILGGAVLGIDLFADRNPAPVSFVLTLLAMDGLLTYRGSNFYLIGEWFLGCILILYLLYPLLRHLLYRYKHLLPAAGLLLCLILEKTWCLDMPLTWFPLYRLFEFVFGMYFISLYREKTRARKTLLLAGAGAGMVTIFLFHVHGKGFIPTIGLGTLCFVFLTCTADLSPVHGPLFEKTILFFSRYAYAAFLLHHLMLVQIVKTFQGHLLVPYHNWMIFCATLILIYTTAFIVHNAVRWLLRASVASLTNHLQAFSERISRRH